MCFRDEFIKDSVKLPKIHMCSVLTGRRVKTGPGLDVNTTLNYRIVKGSGCANVLNGK